MPTGECMNFNLPELLRKLIYNLMVNIAFAFQLMLNGLICDFRHMHLQYHGNLTIR